MASADPRHAYVRFYLSVLAQLDDVHAALKRMAADTAALVQPYADVLATADDPEIKLAINPPTAALTTRALWRPQDPALLSGIVDVYDVVGRFTFQGDDDANLAALNALVKASIDEVDRQRRCLAGLARLPATANRHAEGLSQQEIAAAEAARAKRLEPFEPVAVQLREQCEKVLTAVRGIAPPDLTRLETADGVYKEYVRRMQALYSAALPYLRRALQQLCTVAAVDVPTSWPDTLPFAASLPPDLVAPPPLETTAMARARAQIDQLTAQETQLNRSADELALQQRRLEAEKLALFQKDTDMLAEVNVGKNVVRWAARLDEIDAMLQTIDGQHQQKQARTALVGQLYVQHQQQKVSVASLQTEVTQRQQESAAAAEKLEKQRANPPALFGKDEWRRTVTDLEEDLADLERTLAQRHSVLAQSSQELTALQARAKAEQTQIALIDRAIEEAHAREEALRADTAEIEKALGAHKPAKRMTMAQADEYLARLTAQRGDVRAQIDRVSPQLRQAQDEIDRIAVALRQIGGEKQKLQTLLERSAKSVTAGYDDALAALAERRRAGFLQHVSQVLAPLEESLSQVDRIFIDPARQVLMQRAVGEAPKAGSLRAQAEGLAQVLAQLAPRVEPELATHAEALKRIQSDFCDKVQDAVRAAWAA